MLISLTTFLTGCSLIFTDGSETNVNENGGSSTNNNNTKENTSDNKENEDSGSQKQDDQTTPSSDNPKPDTPTPSNPDTPTPISPDIPPKETYTITFYFYKSIDGVRQVYTTKEVKCGERLNYDDFNQVTVELQKQELPSTKNGYYWRSSYIYEIINDCPLKGKTYDTSSSRYDDYTYGFPIVNYDIDIIPQYVESIYSYNIVFYSPDNEKLFSFPDVTHGTKVTENRFFQTDYYDPVYSKDGKRYTFVGWSTNKDAPVSQAININDVSPTSSKPYYAIYDKSSYDEVFIESKHSAYTKEAAFTFDEGKAEEFFTLSSETTLDDFNGPRVLEKSAPLVSILGKVNINVFFNTPKASSITTIASTAFKYLDHLNYIDFGNVTNINSSAFESTGLSSMTGNKVKTISASAFSNCKSLTSFSLPVLETIEQFAFGDNKGFTTVDLSNTKLVKLGYGAFKNCPNLTSVKLPSTITNYLSNYSQDQNDNQTAIPQFDNCVNLTNITIASNSYIKSENNCIIDIASNKLLYMAQGATIPSSVVTISPGAINYQKSESITIPNSVTSIDASAFKKCSNLTTINYPGTKDSFKNMCASGIGIFSGIENPEEIVLKYSSNLSSSIKMGDLFK